MKNLKVINHEELNDWAKKIFQKNSFNMVDVSSKKKHFEEHWPLAKFMLEKKCLI